MYTDEPQISAKDFSEVEVIMRGNQGQAKLVRASVLYMYVLCIHASATSSSKVIT